MYEKADLGEYKTFLTTLQEHQYEFKFFNEITAPTKQVILRHDIDFDTNAALETAKIEKDLDIKSSYFFLVTNASYNPFDKENSDNIKAIKNMGHVVSLHFDPTIYEDFSKGFEFEKNLFEMAFDVTIDIVSLHRPNDYFLNHNKAIAGIDHSYMDKYFRDIKYVADSGGTWRYGHPFDTEEFLTGKTLQILTHPVWWIYEGDTLFDRLKDFYAKKKESLKSHYSFNCKPFNEIRNELD